MSFVPAADITTMSPQTPDETTGEAQFAPLTRSQSKDAAILDSVAQYLGSPPSHRNRSLSLTKGDVSNTFAAHLSSVDESRAAQHEVDVILHNMYAESDFTTLRKPSQLSTDQLFVNIAGLVRDGVFSIVSLNASKYSFTAIVVCEHGWSEVGDRIAAATME